MSSEYAIALFGIFAGLCAVVALVWAIKHRQLQTEDQAMYEAVTDDEPDYTALASRRPAQVSGPSRWLFATAFTVVGTLIGWLIVQTVRVASRAPAAPPAIQHRPDSE